MGLDLGRHQASLFGELRFQPVTKRIRASHDGSPVLETTDAFVVWEPRRVVPMYAVPRADVVATLTPCPSPSPPADAPPVLGPVHFGWHFHPGSSFTVGVGDASFEASAFVADDPDLGGRVILEWEPFGWTEENVTVTGHPHDPFKRLDVLPSDRHVVVSSGGTLLADTSRAVAIYESLLPVRWYIPQNDVHLDLLTASGATSTCAYKGHAAYYSLVDAASADDPVDIAWIYPDPLPEAELVRDHVCFYAERTDLTLDGEDVPRPDTFWRSRRSAELA